jgi:hypothetical protein
VDLCGRIPVFVKILNIRNALSARIDSKLLLAVVAPLAQAALRVFYALRQGTALPSDYQLEKASCFDERANDLWEQASVAHKVLVVRDAEYLNWRYFENPEGDYVIFLARRDDEIIGYLVLTCDTRFGLRVGYVVDMLTIPAEPNVAHGLLSQAVEYFREQQLDIVSCLMLEHTLYAKVLKKNGFVTLPQRLFPQGLYLGVRRHTDEYSEQFISDSENWFVTWGDHDSL